MFLLEELALFPPPQATVVKHKVKAKQTTVNLRSILITIVFMFVFGYLLQTNESFTEESILDNIPIIGRWKVHHLIGLGKNVLG